MIGLGSNKMSVCRRGGMRVTQAGRGGMEWLAGGRVPSWASPYSAQATAALKAQFPTQWPTIRDYGFAHPALVPFINEDPMMVCSLIPELGWKRYATTDGSTPIDTGVKPSKNLKTHINMKFPTPSTSYSNRNIFGIYNYNGGWRRDTYFLKFNTLSSSSHRICCALSVSTNTSQIDKEIDIPLNTNFSVDITPTKFVVNGTNSNSYTIPSEFEQTYTLVLFGVRVYTRGSASGSGCIYIINECTMELNGVLIRNFVPCTYQGVKGYLDTVNAEFHPNLGTGTLTISETPAS